MSKSPSDRDLRAVYDLAERVMLARYLHPMLLVLAERKNGVWVDLDEARRRGLSVFKIGQCAIVTTPNYAAQNAVLRDLDRPGLI